VQLGEHGLKLDVEGVDALVQGALAFDHFDRSGMELSDGALMELSANEFAARAAGRLLTVSFDNARGLTPGETRVCYLGQPIGLVESIQPSPSTGLILVAFRLMPEYEHLADTSATFTLVRPHVSLQGVTGLDTLVTGVYIELAPGMFSIHDVYLIHGANPNNSGKRRAGMVFRYMPASSYFDRELASRQVRDMGVLDLSRRKLFQVRGSDRSGKNDIHR
jgi:paraquat-inducible protein B